MRLLAIDPGDIESALLIYDPAARRVEWWAKLANDEALGKVTTTGCDRLAVEMVASYGMPVGKTVFETCVWIGRFVERWEASFFDAPSPLMIYRPDAKLHICHSRRAKDGNVRQALMDRYGSTRQAAIGTKAAPGPLYGLAGDGWAALAVAITAAETRLAGTEAAA